MDLISERSQNRDSVIEEISSKWGGKQTLYGPFVRIVYRKQIRDEKNNLVWETFSSIVSADELTIEGDLKTSIKKRNIYKAILYQTDLNVNATFESYDSIINHLKIDSSNVISSKLIIGISDEKGITERIVARDATHEYEFLYDQYIDIRDSRYYNSASDISYMSCEFDTKKMDLSAVQIPVKLKGSQEIYFVASAKNTKVTLTTDWEDLKYDGNYLPEQQQQKQDSISKKFLETANWSIFQSSPMKGKYWSGNSDFDSYKFGVEFLQMSDNYTKVDRSVKYAILFIGLTFITFFFAENRGKLNMHLVHYGLVGISICVNFVLLLSISEYLGFDWAYLISASATILLIVSFVHGLAKDKKITSIIFLVLSLLYLFIYAILQLKEQALLVGSIGIFIIVSILMHFSKKIKWS
ncbi:cell envelope integrity protein CreD [Bacteroidales bacterium]|nr:cell envelope integrity protein CreD [Bacteroidales bacterium]